LVGEYLENGLAGRHHIAIALLVVLGVLNWFGLKAGARTQQALSLFKVAGLVVLALVCLAVGGSAGTESAPSASTVSFAAFIGATVLITETYAGWNSGVYFSEEDKDTGRNIPRALFWGIGAMMGAYLLLNAGLLAVLPQAQLAASNLPAADASQLVFGENGRVLVRTFAVVSLVGILNVGVMYTPRIFYAMGRGGMLPQGLSHLNRYSTPDAALIACLIPAAALAAGLTFEFLFTVSAFLGLAINTAVFLSFFRLRKRLPAANRPFRARWHPWAPMFATLVNIGLLVSFVATDPAPGLFGIAAVALSWPVYWSLRRQRQHADSRTAAANLPD
jgi:APA family basic amino acid/polyamine antiporter